MEWWKTTFLEAIRDIGRTVMIMEPWEDPIPLTRAWCIWEVLCTCQTGAKFEIAMTKPQRARFISALNNEYGSIMKMVCHIDCRRAEAWKDSDRVAIMNCVETTVGFVQMNAMVVSCIRTWILGMARNELIRPMTSRATAFISPAVLTDTVLLNSSVTFNVNGESTACKKVIVSNEYEGNNGALCTDLAVETVKLLRDQNILQDALLLGDQCLIARTAYAAAMVTPPFPDASRKAVASTLTNNTVMEGSTTEVTCATSTAEAKERYIAKTVELMIVNADIAYEMLNVEKATRLIEDALILHSALCTGRVIDRLDILFCKVAMRVNLGRRGGTWLFCQWLYEFRKIGRNRWKVFISDSAKRPGLMMMARSFMAGLRMQHDFERHLEIPRGKARFLAVFEAFLQVVQEEYGSVHPTTLLGMMVVGRELTKERVGGGSGGKAVTGVNSGGGGARNNVDSNDHHKQSDIERAEQMLRAAVDGATVTMGRSRGELVSAMMGLADCLEVQGKCRAALRVYQCAANTCADVVPKKSPFLALCGAARCHRAVGAYTSSLHALELAERELVEQYHMPAQHPLYKALLRSRGYTLLAMSAQRSDDENSAHRGMSNAQQQQEAKDLLRRNKLGNMRLQNLFINTMNTILFSFLGAPS